MDKVSIDRVSKLHPLLRNEVMTILQEVQNAGVNIRVTQGLRTIAEQDALYAQGRTKPGKIVTNAKGGQSYHNWALALDICLLHKDGSVSWSLNEDLDKDGIADWMEVVKVFEKYGWEWGGKWKFKDTPHFQKTFGKSLNDLKALPKDSNGYVKL